MRSHRGFTLIELTAVLVILALLSSVVGLSLASVGRQTTLRDAVSAVADLDRSLRVECMDYNRTGELRFDLEDNRVVLSIRRDGETVDVQAYQFPTQMTLLWVKKTNGGNLGQRATSVVIPCDQQGQTPTYALAIGMKNSPGPEPVLWVIAGLSGQLQELTDESQVTDLFTTALASGNAG